MQCLFPAMDVAKSVQQRRKNSRRLQPTRIQLLTKQNCGKASLDCHNTQEISRANRVTMWVITSYTSSRSCTQTPRCVQRSTLGNRCKGQADQKHLYTITLASAQPQPCMSVKKHSHLWNLAVQGYFLIFTEVWKLNFRQYGKMERAQPGRNSDVKKVRGEKIRDG